MGYLSPEQPMACSLNVGRLSTFIGNPPVLAPAANNPNLISNGGFGEGWYGGGVATGWPRSTEDILTTNTTSGAQMELRGELGGMGFNDTALSYDVSVAWSDSSIEQNYATLIRDRTEMALYGLGGPNCTPNGTRIYTLKRSHRFQRSPAYSQLCSPDTC